MFFFFKQKTAYEMRISDWSSDVCSSDLKSAQNIVELVVECLTLDLQLIADLTVVVLAVQRLVEHKSGGIGGKPVIVAARLQFVLAIAKDILQRDTVADFPARGVGDPPGLNPREQILHIAVDPVNTAPPLSGEGKSEEH